MVGLLAVALGASGCASVQSADGPTQVALLELDCTPPDAEVWVDEQYVGRVTEWRGGIVPLRPGKHRVMIAADGFYAYRMDLDAVGGRAYRLSLDLVVDLDAEDGALEREEP